MDCFKVGFGRVNITPDHSVPLASYGTSKFRHHDRVLNELYFSAIAITGTNNKTILLTTYDITQSWSIIRNKLAERLKNDFGFDPDYLHLSGTHTHSSVDIWFDSEDIDKYNEELLEKAYKACKQALEDRKDAKMFVGETKTRNLNFIRHYIREDGSVAGDNFGVKSPVPYKGHLSEIDESLRLIKFKRTNPDGSEARDVVIVNWQSHNHLTGGFTKKDLAADFSGAMVKFIESKHNCYASFFQGCAGNINPKSRIKTENRTENYLEHGKFLSEHIDEIYDESNLTEIPAGEVVCANDIYRAKINRAESEKLEAALSVLKFRDEQGGVNKEGTKFAMSLGFHSVYHAVAIVNRSKIKETEIELPMFVHKIGNVGWTAVPLEMFDQTGKEIRSSSPFPFTITQGYTNASYGYLPTTNSFKYGCYEADTSKFAEGTAESIRDKLIEMLKSIY